MTAHVRKFTYRKDRRIMARLPSAYRHETLCGAPITDRDMDMSDARRSTHTELASWNICPTCIERAKGKTDPKLVRAIGRALGYAVEPEKE